MSAFRLLALLGVLLSAGCAASRRPFSAGGPQRLAAVFLVDGLDAGVLDAMLKAGELPVIERDFVRGGTRVRNAVNAVPAVTYANVTTLLTGVWPARHGILGNRWFDPQTGRARDYGYAGTFRRVNDDLQAPTIFELLAPAPTAAVQLHTRRGATKVIDSSIANGLDWALGCYDRVNARAAEALPRLDRFARRTGTWPVLTVYYFPGVDEIGHRFGPDAPRYRRAIRRVDATIGRICDGLRERGLFQRCYRVLVSDHGMVATPAARRFDLTRWLAKRTGLRVRAVRGPLADPLARQRSIRNADIVVVADAGRRAHVHMLRGQTGSTRAAARGEGTANSEQAMVVAGRVGTFRSDGATQRRGEQASGNGEQSRRCEPAAGPSPSRQRSQQFCASLFDLQALPAVDLVCLRRDNGCVEIRSRLGAAVVQRQVQGGRRAYRMQVLTARDPLGYDADQHAARLLDGQWHASRAWLTTTAGLEHPDFVPQVVDLFDTPRAGELIIFAADDWTLRREGPGSHGGAVRRDRIVPLMFAGPAIPPGRTLDAARTSDLVPTLLSLLGVEPPPDAAFDGVVLPVAAAN